MSKYKYEDVMPVDSYQSTAWLVQHENGCNQLHLWHKDAKIEDIVAAVKVVVPAGNKFTVAAVDVGMFTIGAINHSLSNGRKVDQDMCIHIDV